MDNYSSIHVLQSTLEEVETFIKKCECENKKEFMEKSQNTITNIDGEEIDFKELYDAVHTLKKSELKKREAFYFAENDNNISVVSNYLGFETIKDDVFDWFSDFNGTLVVVRCFDYDILEISIFNNGQFVTTHVIGDTENYDVEKNQFDFKLLSQIFNISENDLKRSCSNDIDNFLDNYSELFKLPLKIKVTDVKVNTRKYYYNVNFIRF